MEPLPGLEGVFWTIGNQFPKGPEYQKTMVFIDSEGSGISKNHGFLSILNGPDIKKQWLFIDFEWSGYQKTMVFIDFEGSPPDALGSLCNALWWGDAV